MYSRLLFILQVLLFFTCQCAERPDGYFLYQRITLVWQILSLYPPTPVYHPVSCSYCRSNGMTGFRYRCLRCRGYQLCQNCFWRGNTSGSHSNKHQMKEHSSWVSHRAVPHPSRRFVAVQLVHAKAREWKPIRFHMFSSSNIICKKLWIPQLVYKHKVHFCSILWCLKAA